MICPKCGSEDYTSIMYGYPSQEAVKAAERGELILGGCELPKKMVNAECNSCKKRFKVKSQKERPSFFQKMIGKLQGK